MMPLQHPICLAYLERIDRKRGAEATRYNTQRHLSRFEIHCQLNLFAPPEIVAEPKTFSNAELRAILRSCRSERDRVLFHLLAYTGMRRGEIRNLCWGEINFAQSTITVTHAKGQKIRKVAIHPVLQNVLSHSQTRRAWVLGNSHRDAHCQTRPGTCVSSRS